MLFNTPKDKESIIMPKAKSEKPTIETFTRLIEKKREGKEYMDQEIRSIVDAILDEEMPEYQQAAWVMTTFFQGMSAQEIANFTEEMMLSGEVIEMMDVSRPKIEKYSTGGVGDKNHFSTRSPRSRFRSGYAHDEWR